MIVQVKYTLNSPERDVRIVIDRHLTRTTKSPLCPDFRFGAFADGQRVRRGACTAVIMAVHVSAVAEGGGG